MGQREDTKIVVSGERKTFHWRMPQAKDTRASKEDYQIIQGTAQLQDRGIPQLLPLEIKLHYFEIRFEVSSPLSHKLREIQLEDDLQLATKQQASEMQISKFMTYVRRKGLSL